MCKVVPDSASSYVQGRYILSHAATTNFKEVSDAMQAAFPDWPIAAAKSTTPQKCFDISKVDCLSTP